MQRPRVRLSFEESRMKFISTNELRRKSGVWGTRPSRENQGCPKSFWREGMTQVRLPVHNDARLRKHADYQRVYQRSRKNFSSSMTYFFAERTSTPPVGPRVGLTAGRVLGKAVERNRIKRRMREAVRMNLALLTRDVDVVLHPRRTVLTAEFAGLQSEVSRIFAIVEKAGREAG
jgi:ribonuclease P protein component